MNYFCKDWIKRAMGWINTDRTIKVEINFILKIEDILYDKFRSNFVFI
jgi:hypothetical protein